MLDSVSRQYGWCKRTSQVCSYFLLYIRNIISCWLLLDHDLGIVSNTGYRGLVFIKHKLVYINGAGIKWLPCQQLLFVLHIVSIVVIVGTNPVFILPRVHEK